MAIASNDRLAIFLCLFMVVAAASPVMCADDEKSETVSHDDIAGEPALKANAAVLERTIVTPYLAQKIEPGKNVLWCSTFQLVWNELRDLAGGTLDLDGDPAIAKSLNAEEASRDDLDEESYVAAAGIAGEGILAAIARELEEKFKGAASPELLPEPGSLPKGAWVTYAYLFKNLPFEYAFTRFERPFRFAGKNVSGFGIEQYMKAEKNEARMAEQVAVIDHKGNDDFIVELKTRARGDRLILARIPPSATLGETIARVRARVEKSDKTGAGTIEPMETLGIPVLNFDIMREYDELVGHKIKAQNPKVDGTPIGIALQSIRFKLDETGAVLKSEALMVLGMTERSLVFRGPFLILLTRRGAENPYFALWVDNDELLVPHPEKEAEKAK